MEDATHRFVSGVAQAHWSLLLALIAALLAALAKSADWLVEEAVTVAKRSHVPTAVIGATVVSLGTTTPETAVSVMAALQGNPDLALGNAVGSIICDTGLILGLACMLGPVPLDRRVVNRQGLVQLGSGLLLAALSYAFGARLPRGVGFLLLGLLAAYLWFSVKWSREKSAPGLVPAHAEEPLAAALAKLGCAIALVVASCHLLIPAVEEAARLAGVPQDVIAATLVAFGTSTPELVTSVTAVRKGRGELAAGNVIGADILNVLFVTGAACAATPGGLAVPPSFFRLHYPVMIAVLVVFRAGVFFSGEILRRPFGVVLLSSYALYLVLQYLFLGGLGGV